MSWLLDCWRTSIGGKVTMAVTGLLLFLFVLGHLLGNLQLLQGADAINAYAHWLKGHPLLLWPARLGLLAVFALHVATGVRLARENRMARPVPYTRKGYRQADLASRSMVWTGLTVLAFVVYHLLHFTMGITNPDHFARVDALGRHDVYGMVVAGFATPGIALVYVAANVILFLHLAHGARSLVQTLGLDRLAASRPVRAGCWLLAGVLAGGNVLLALSVLTGVVPS